MKTISNLRMQPYLWRHRIATELFYSLNGVDAYARTWQIFDNLEEARFWLMNLP